MFIDRNCSALRIDSTSPELHDNFKGPGCQQGNHSLGTPITCSYLTIIGCAEIDKMSMVEHNIDVGNTILIVMLLNA